MTTTTEQTAPVPGWSRTIRMPLPAPPDRWGEEIHIGRLSRLWGVSQRALRRYARTGLLPGWPGESDRPGPPFWFSRASICDFTRHALLLRQVVPGLVIRCGHWQDGRPMRVIEASITPDDLWEISARTCDGVLMHAPPCPGTHLVRQVPPDLGAAQRRAYDELGVILQRHRDLTTLTWSLETDRAGVIGQVAGSNAYVIERAFAEWQRALRLTVQPATSGRLTASRFESGYHVTLIADLSGEPRKDTP